MNHAEIEHQIDDYCDQFEAELKAGQLPAVGKYLQRVEPEYQQRLLRELLLSAKELLNSEQLKQCKSNYQAECSQHATLIEECLDQSTEVPRGPSDAPVSAKPAPATPASAKSLVDSGYPTDQDRSISSQMGSYRLLEKLGEGGMGEVWKAQQVEPVQRPVALKLIKQGLDSQEILRRFEAERQALALMNHPNIAQILDAGATPGGAPFFAMELIQGSPLTDYCNQNRLSIQARLDLFLDVCSGIQHAHQKGIIHRDLKPTNILVAAPDGRPVPKIIDFGLAKAVEQAQQLTEHSMCTGVGRVFGTFKYMSPEQASLGAVDIDTRTDIYALGVLLYELLTGSTPLDDHQIRERAVGDVLETIRKQEPTKPSTKLAQDQSNIPLATIAAQRRTDGTRLKSNLARDLDWIVLKALEQDRARRYDSAAGLAADIRRYLDGDPVVARPPSVHYRLRKFARKHRVGVMAASLVLLTLIGAFLGTSWGMWQAIEARKHEETQRKIASLARDEAEKQKQEAEAALRRERDLLIESIELAEQLGSQFFDAGERELALPLFEKSWRRSRDILGPESEITLRQMYSVSYLYGLDNRIAEAIPILEELCRLAPQVHGYDDRSTRVAHNNLASYYLRVNRVEEAKQLFEQVFEMQQATMDPNEYEYRLGYRWLVITYSMTEEWDKALPICSEWLAYLERVGESDAPEYAWATCSLAEIQFGLKNYREAESAAKRTLQHVHALVEDISRAKHIAAACRLVLSTDQTKPSSENVNALENAYAELKATLDSLPGFKQYFVTNAAKRSRDTFRHLGMPTMAENWEQEVKTIEAHILAHRKAAHPGIPIYDPETKTEQPKQ